ncbi:MAG: restriction endonuclease [Thermoflexales bacterium]|nr:restriction endonuclease [Thermoflexales bacterium]
MDYEPAMLCVGLPILGLFVFVSAALWAFVQDQVRARQRADETSALLAHHLAEARSQAEFRARIAAILEQRGFAAHVPRPPSGAEDWQTDLIAVDASGKRWFVFALRHNGAISAATISVAEARRQLYQCTACMLITNGRFQAAARQRAAQLGCVLVDREQLAEWLRTLSASPA